ncbi:hypothetical protein [Tomitella biformata]|uniref:hypothetical protein n=1 Tax=Tomitella biformata TaxID=630403 RepID=UPI0004651A84|nr:hypothetical protein [Tomitella biformata]
MSIPLTLRPPTPRNEHPLTVGLLLVDRPGTISAAPSGPDDEAIARMLGPARVAASAAGADQSGLFIDLDLDPAELGAVTAPRRYLLDCAAADLAQALDLQTPAPLVLFVEPDATHGLADLAALVVAAGQSVGLVAGRSNEEIADFFAVLTHSMVGFVLRAADAEDVVRLLAATVASMRGDDVRAALAQPNLRGLLGLGDEAAATVREILLGIEVADPVGVAAELLARGLGAGL